MDSLNFELDGEVGADLDGDGEADNAFGELMGALFAVLDDDTVGDLNVYVGLALDAGDMQRLEHVLADWDRRAPPYREPVAENPLRAALEALGYIDGEED